MMASWVASSAVVTEQYTSPFRADISGHPTTEPQTALSPIPLSGVVIGGPADAVVLPDYDRAVDVFGVAFRGVAALFDDHGEVVIGELFALQHERAAAQSVIDHGLRKLRCDQGLRIAQWQLRADRGQV
jgi:hypothetical protein